MNTTNSIRQRCNDNVTLNDNDNDNGNGNDNDMKSNKIDKLSVTATVVTPSLSSATISSLDSSKSSSSSSSSHSSNVKSKSLQERNKPPFSFYLSIFIILSLQYYSGIYSYSNIHSIIIPSIQQSFTSSYKSILYQFQYVHSLLITNQKHSLTEYIYTTIFILLFSSIIYVLLYSPFQNGMWTGNTKRITKHKVHRYFGLCFLILYFISWMEFIFCYEDSFQFSFLPHIISLNGKCV
jgi:hypothetical protein